jgi:hypothetical protein
MKRYIVFVEHGCPLSIGGQPGRADDWRVYEGNEPVVGMKLNDGCGGGMHPYTSCDDGPPFCNERGIVKEVLDYTQAMAQELGLD